MNMSSVLRVLAPLGFLLHSIAPAHVPAPTASPTATPKPPETIEEFRARVQQLERRVRTLELERNAAQFRYRDLRKEVDELGPFFKEAKYLKLVAEVQEQVETIRGIAIDDRIHVNILSREQLSTLLVKLLDQELAAPRFRGQFRVYEVLGMVPEAMNLRDIYLALLEGQVGGLYDDKTQSLYVVDTFDPKGFLGRIILAHEICHALQDRQYGISKLPFRTNNTDQNSATGAMLEGDATLLMVEWAGDEWEASALLEFQNAFKGQEEQLNAVPPFLVQQLLFPYLQGLQFCLAQQLAGVEDWRTRIFTEGPRSTEQVLHPRKWLLEPDEPELVLLGKPASDSGLRETYRDTVGEWGMRLILTPPDLYPKFSIFDTDPLLKEPVAVAGAEGWEGDTLTLLEADDDARDNWAVVWASRWDRPDDVAEFVRALRRRIAVIPGFESAGSGDTITAADGRVVRLQVDAAQRSVVFILASSEKTATAAAAVVP